MTEEEKRVERGKQEFHIGDRVIVHSASGKPLYDGKVATIIEKGIVANEVYYGLYVEGIVIDKYNIPNYINQKQQVISKTSLLAPFFAEDLELINPYKDVRRAEETTPERHEITIPVKAEIDATYWTAYRAEIAKEIAVKVANGNSVKDTKIAEYAVDFATKVAEVLVKTEKSFNDMIEWSHLRLFDWLEDTKPVSEESVKRLNKVVKKLNKTLKRK